MLQSSIQVNSYQFDGIKLRTPGAEDFLTAMGIPLILPLAVAADLAKELF